ncbi:class I SAM-dependent methyltransferase [Amycolatopsis sp. FDAARGOS 1241]|uniref:class I SAM-dependent methyltransferase n=1 Tax=Amycolatopsis sp. FDAARGOS 1241 TaxID=2778070 RepID=UPI0019519F4F|nr:methyltransferase domain-containing protein [Amycolatopsis sp. FDAARGOS 1241]QRP47026.1 methyltransferase domain-containing protein [Amycolatopsis sp. FDAARGOS 1241]
MSITTEFFRHPMLTGAIAASSGSLATAMTRDLGLESARSVVELGPGTGVFTASIVAALPPSAAFAAVEINPRLVGALRRAFPSVSVVEGSAETLATLLAEACDVVVSGLPWTAMPAVRQRQVLDAICGTLSSHGRFTTFAYAHTAWTPPARRFARLLRSRFSVVERTRVVWRNLPPAYVYRAALPACHLGALRDQPAAAAS